MKEVWIKPTDDKYFFKKSHATSYAVAVVVHMNLICEQLEKMKSKARRSLAKTLSWRILATSDTFVISWLITGTLSMAGAIAGIEVVTKMFLYYGHERIWNKIKWGKDKTDHPTYVFPYEDWKVKRVKIILIKKVTNV